MLKDNLIMLRKLNGYSQEQLADKLGIARQTLSKWENGQAVPELGNLISLSNLLINSRKSPLFLHFISILCLKKSLTFETFGAMGPRTITF